MTPEERKKAMQAISQEKGGQVLLEHLSSQMERMEREWLSLIGPDSRKKMTSAEELFQLQSKYQADRAAYRRVISLISPPKEQSNE